MQHPSTGEGACCNAANPANPVRCSKSNRWMGRCILREAREKAQAHAESSSAAGAKHVRFFT